MYEECGKSMKASDDIFKKIALYGGGDVRRSLGILENAYYSVITPEGCAAILWKDRKYAPQAAEALQLTADKLIELGIADEIIPEPFGGAHCDHDEAAKMLAVSLKKHLAELSRLSGAKIKAQRYEKFRIMGKVEEIVSEGVQG